MRLGHHVVVIDSDDELDGATTEIDVDSSESETERCVQMTPRHTVQWLDALDIFKIWLPGFLTERPHEMECKVWQAEFDSYLSRTTRREYVHYGPAKNCTRIIRLLNGSRVVLGVTPKSVAHRIVYRYRFRVTSISSRLSDGSIIFPFPLEQGANKFSYDVYYVLALGICRKTS